MSGHEPPAAVCIERVGQRARTMHALPVAKRFATAQASQTRKAVGFYNAEAGGEALYKAKGSFYDERPCAHKNDDRFSPRSGNRLIENFACLKGL
ncbi:hypothetical protein [Mucilaginibacter sp. OK098]|uniref:hypothetical protein n=1 Tax=Mucilaginibacter sp. OK098 TaxID=1855297 RepID=UPI00116119A8|nr:hypothetical protein [Mucilaginibacter sp. OK098]